MVILKFIPLPMADQPGPGFHNQTLQQPLLPAKADGHPLLMLPVTVLFSLVPIKGTSIFHMTGDIIGLAKQRVLLLQPTAVYSTLLL